MKVVQGVDPVLASVIQRRFNAITNAMGDALLRSSRSPIFNEAGDFVTGLFDLRGRMIEQSAYIPIIGFGAQPAIPRLMEYFADDLHPGDVFLHNDVYDGGNQTADMGVYQPVFFEGQHVAWAVAKGHLADLGGAVPGGYNPRHTEVWQEAIRVPGLRIIHRRQVVRDVWRTLFANVRFPMVEADVRAMIGACHLGEREFQAVLDKYGLPVVQAHVDYILTQTAERVQSLIRSWPEGDYYGEGVMINDGFDPLKRYYIRVKVSIRDGKIRIDFTGTDPQAPGYTNMPPAAAKAACAIAYLMLINPGAEIPVNDGLFSALECVFPEGTLVNPRFPAATLFGNQMADVVLEAIMNALKDAMPTRVTANWAKACPPEFNGLDPRSGQPYMDFGFLCKGGQGAMKGHDGFDGIGFSGTVGRMRSQDPEMWELKVPVFVAEYEYWPDSHGAGEYCGGLGTYLRVRLDGEHNAVGMIGDGMEYEGAAAPQGYFGGQPGTLNRAVLTYPDGRQQLIGSKDKITNVPRGSWVEVWSGGGGGVGNPKDRPRERVLAEVRDGLLSADRAAAVYGVDENALRQFRDSLG